MEPQAEAPNTLRDALEASFDEVEQAQPVSEPVVAVTERPRDESGKFAKVEKENLSPVATTHDIPEPEVLQRPTTWKKEYLPLWDKLQNGEQLTKDETTRFLKYANQRESEYKTGVSTYKGEAENARALQEAIAPFIPDLQKYGIHPATWINNLGRAHQILALGNDQQRLDTFIRLAAEYKVPLQSLLGGQQPDQQVMQNIEELSQTRGQVEQLAQWVENEKTARLTAEINRVKSDVEHFPHFEQVRGTMAQLLESQLAPNLEEAYAKAVRMQDDVWQIERERLLTQARTEASKTNQVAKAKAAAVSPRSSTPRVQANLQSAKDRRSALSSAFDDIAGSRV